MPKQLAVSYGHITIFVVWWLIQIVHRYIAISTCWRKAARLKDDDWILNFRHVIYERIFGYDAHAQVSLQVVLHVLALIHSC